MKKWSAFILFEPVNSSRIKGVTTFRYPIYQNWVSQKSFTKIAKFVVHLDKVTTERCWKESGKIKCMFVQPYIKLTSKNIEFIRQRVMLANCWIESNCDLQAICPSIFHVEFECIAWRNVWWNVLFSEQDLYVKPWDLFHQEKKKLFPIRSVKKLCRIGTNAFFNPYFHFMFLPEYIWKYETIQKKGKKGVNHLEEPGKQNLTFFVLNMR